MSDDGRSVQIVGSNASVVRANDSAVELAGPHADCRDVGISRDGNWVYASHLGANKASVWNARSGSLVATVEGANFLFSPDGKWFWSDNTRFETGTWRKSPPQSNADGLAPMAYSPDGGLLVGEARPGVIALADAAAGKTLARLSSPLAALMVRRGQHATFSADGSQVLLWERDRRCLVAWNLRAIREHLAGLGLDWDSPPLPPAKEDEGRAPPRLEVRGTQPLETIDSLKTIGLAFQNFHDVYRRFPASTYDKDGKMLLSWRVHILPYVGYLPLYQQFHLDEPWDSEHNRPLAAQMPAVFRSQDFEDRERTLYLAATGPKALFPKGKANDGRSFGESMANIPVRARTVSFRDVTDGTANTIMVVEADPEKAVVWTKPDDLDLDSDDPRKGLGKLRRIGFNAVFGDGSIHFIRNTLDLDVLRHLFDPRDGRVIPAGSF